MEHTSVPPSLFSTKVLQVFHAERREQETDGDSLQLVVPVSSASEVTYTSTEELSLSQGQRSNKKTATTAGREREVKNSMGKDVSNDVTMLGRFATREYQVASTSCLYRIVNRSAFIHCILSVLRYRYDGSYSRATAIANCYHAYSVDIPNYLHFATWDR